MDDDAQETPLRGNRIQPVRQVDTQRKEICQIRRPIPINRHLKPIKNRNLVTNPYTNKTSLFEDLKRLEKARKDELVGKQSCDLVAHKNSPLSLEEMKEREKWGTRELFEQ